jgi:hypothetical protein
MLSSFIAMKAAIMMNFQIAKIEKKLDDFDSIAPQ